MTTTVDIYFFQQDKVFELIHKSKDEIVTLLGDGYNDKHARKWMYRRCSHKTFWAKKYMYILFDDKHKAVEVRLKRWKEK